MDYHGVGGLYSGVVIARLALHKNHRASAGLVRKQLGVVRGDKLLIRCPLKNPTLFVLFL